MPRKLRQQPPSAGAFTGADLMAQIEALKAANPRGTRRAQRAARWGVRVANMQLLVVWTRIIAFGLGALLVALVVLAVVMSR